MPQAVYAELVSGIIRALGKNVKRIVLYGSTARGSDDFDSDVDVAIFMTSSLSDEMEDRLSDVVVEMNLKYNKVFSVIDINDNLYQKWRNVSPFYQNVDNDGIVLWAAA